MILVIVSINRVYSTKKKTADMFTFTEEILNGKLHFLCCDLLMVSPFLYNRKESRYPPGGDTLYFDKEVKPYSSKKPTPITISNKTKTKNEEKFQQWSARYTQAVKQRTLRQENTIAKMGTLSQFIYLKNTKEIAERIKSRKKERSK